MGFGNMDYIPLSNREEEKKKKDRLLLLTYSCLAFT